MTDHAQTEQQLKLLEDTAYSAPAESIILRSKAIADEMLALENGSLTRLDQHARAVHLLARRLHETGQFARNVIESEPHLRRLDTQENVAHIAPTLIGALQYLSSSLTMLGKPEETLEKLHRCRLLSHKFCPGELPRVLANLGTCHGRMGSLQESNALFEQVVELLRANRDDQSLIVLMATYNNLVTNCIELEAYDNGLRWGQLCEQLYRRAEDEGKDIAELKVTLGFLYNNLAKLHLAQGNTDASVEFFRSGLETNTESQDLLAILYSRRGLGHAYASLGRLDQAIEHLELSLDIASSLESPQELANTYGALADAHEERGDFEDSLRYHRLFHRHYEQVYNQETKSTLEVMRASHELDLAAIKHEALERDNALLTKAYAEQEELVNIVSHDIRTPLASVSLGLELLLGEFENHADEDLRRRTHRIWRTSHYAQQVAAQLSSLSSLNNQLGEVVDHRLALSEQVLRASERLDQQRSKKGICFELSVAPEVHVSASETVLGQILDNLLSNAIKYSWPNSTVLVTATYDHFEVHLRIADDGVGIEPEELGLLYQKFGRLPSSTPTGNETSIGLGLYVSRRHASLLKGKLEITSDGLNQGTTATLTLRRA